MSAPRISTGRLYAVETPCKSLAFGGPDPLGASEHWCVLPFGHPMECRDETHWWKRGRHPLVFPIDTNDATGWCGVEATVHTLFDTDADTPAP